MLLCPVCQNSLGTVSSRKDHVIDPKNPDPEVEGSSNSSENIYYLRCSHCRWDSIEIGYYSSLPADLMRVSEQIFAKPFSNSIL